MILKFRLVNDQNYVYSQKLFGSILAIKNVLIISFIIFDMFFCNAEDYSTVFTQYQFIKK